MRFSFPQSSLLLITSVGLVACGCASTAVAPSGVGTERRSVAGVEIQSVHLRTNANGLIVYGAVRQSFGYSGMLQSHLDVEVVAPDGSVWKQIAINYRPRPIPRSYRIRKHSDYAVQISDVPPPGSVVRVSHHPVSQSKCQKVRS